MPCALTGSLQSDRYDQFPEFRNLCLQASPTPRGRLAGWRSVRPPRSCPGRGAGPGSSWRWQSRTPPPWLSLPRSPTQSGSSSDRVGRRIRRCQAVPQHAGGPVCHNGPWVRIRRAGTRVGVKRRASGSRGPRLRHRRGRVRGRETFISFPCCRQCAALFGLWNPFTPTPTHPHTDTLHHCD